jgi:tRNA A-37 threonylcarbamoyl transferase component Bud32
MPKLPKLSKNEFEQLTEGAKILEQDGFGIKVLRLSNQRILKLFRRRRLISSQLWGPHAFRFKMNATKLQKHGIPTVKVEDIYNIPKLDRQAVIYRELQGITLRQWLDEHDDKQVQTKLTAFAHFVAKLHAQGILFRSLHLGNVLVTADEQLALIDIVDMSFRCFGPLSTQQRIRNFKHITRYPKDRTRLTQASENVWIDTYAQAINCSPKVYEQLIQSFHQA